MAALSAQLHEDENLLARLDRIPLTRSIVGIMILLAFVWLAEAFDIGIVGPVIAMLNKTWHLTAGQQGTFAIASILGVVLGMIPAGAIADRFGRRRVALIGLTAFSVLTFLGALANSFDTLVAVRFLSGLGEGAILPLPYLFLSEFVHTRRRAVTVGYTNGILTAAYLIPNLCGAWALGAFPASIAWHVPFLLGGIPLLLTIPLARWLPESPRFLLKRGERDKVRRLVERLEDEAGLPHDSSLVNKRALAVIHKGMNQRPTLSTLLRQPYLSRGLITAAQLTAALLLFYIVLSFGPAILGTRGLGTSNAIVITGVMMGVAGFGSVAQGYLSDRFGRRPILALYYGLAALGCGLFGLFRGISTSVIAGFLISFFGLGVFPVAKIAVAEQYPTRLRGKGVYYNEMIARFIAGTATFFIPLLLSAVNHSLLFDGIGVAIVFFALPIVVFGRETARISVEEAGTDLTFDQLDAQVVLPEAGASVPGR